MNLKGRFVSAPLLDHMECQCLVKVPRLFSCGRLNLMKNSWLLLSRSHFNWLFISSLKNGNIWVTFQVIITKFMPKQKCLISKPCEEKLYQLSFKNFGKLRKEQIVVSLALTSVSKRDRHLFLKTQQLMFQKVQYVWMWQDRVLRRKSVGNDEAWTSGWACSSEAGALAWHRVLGWIPNATEKECFLRRRQKDEELKEGHSWLQMVFDSS